VFSNDLQVFQMYVASVSDVCCKNCSVVAYVSAGGRADMTRRPRPARRACRGGQAARRAVRRATRAGGRVSRRPSG
jgi:hypothetical protein